MQVKHSVVAAVVACGILVSGCQRKAEGQTVAVVNGQEITVPDLNFALSQIKVPADVTADLKGDDPKADDTGKTKPVGDVDTSASAPVSWDTR